MKRIVFFIAIAVLSFLFAGCSSRYKGVPWDAMTYWDYILDQYASPESLQFNECYTFVAENGMNSVVNMSFELMFAQILPDDEKMIELLQKYEYTEDIPDVIDIVPFSYSAYQICQAKSHLVMLAYRVPDRSGKYQDQVDLFLVPFGSDIAYALPQNN